MWSEMTKAYLFNILGTSLKKLDRSTSFFVAVQVISYENRCANMAIDSGIPRPPKKKKLVSNEFLLLMWPDENSTLTRMEPTSRFPRKPTQRPSRPVCIAAMCSPDFRDRKTRRLWPARSRSCACNNRRQETEIRVKSSSGMRA